MFAYRYYYIIYKFIHYKGSILHARIQGR